MRSHVQRFVPLPTDQEPGLKKTIAGLEYDSDAGRVLGRAPLLASLSFHPLRPKSDNCYEGHQVTGEVFSRVSVGQGAIS